MEKMETKFSLDQMKFPVIEPSKDVVEDFEIIAFDNEEALNYYSVWHETLYDKRREFNAESERERQIIRNEIVRKTKQFLLGTYECNPNNDGSTSFGEDDKGTKRRRPASSSRSRSKRPPASLDVSFEEEDADGSAPEGHENPAASPRKISPVRRSRPSGSSKSHRRQSSGQSRRSQPSSTTNTNENDQQQIFDVNTSTNPDQLNGFTILNSTYYNTLPAGKGTMKYKLTKLYNKFRGRQTRRNYVLDKQRAAKIEDQVSKSYLNTWLAYNALQAVRVPEPSKNQLSTIAINNNPRFITIPQPQTPPPVASPAPSSTSSKRGSKKSKKQQAPAQTPTQQSNGNHQSKPPMHLVYIDPSDIVTYSNKINPQQIAAYHKRPQILPSSANSKKSSAASYDVYEIMEVLANSDKTNVTITRNANKPAPNGQSIFSKSVNANTPGIVSTQLHLQAKSYLDSVAKFYAEEADRIARVDEELKNEPPVDEQVDTYLKRFWPNGYSLPSQTCNSPLHHTCDDAH